MEEASSDGSEYINTSKKAKNILQKKKVTIESWGDMKKRVQKDLRKDIDK